MSTRALAAIDLILNAGEDPDDVLRLIVAELVHEPEIEWAGVLFLENGSLVLGPEAGVTDRSRRISVPVLYLDAFVGELSIDGVAEVPFLEQVAQLISTHVLLGWDTGGETWDP